MYEIKNLSSTTASIELGDNDSIAITKNGKVVGYVKVKRERENGIELVGYPVNFQEWTAPDELRTFNSFACSGTINATLDEMSSADKFIAAIDAE